MASCCSPHLFSSVIYLCALPPRSSDTPGASCPVHCVHLPPTLAHLVQASTPSPALPVYRYLPPILAHLVQQALLSQYTCTYLLSWHTWYNKPSSPSIPAPTSNPGTLGTPSPALPYLHLPHVLAHLVHQALLPQYTCTYLQSWHTWCCLPQGRS